MTSFRELYTELGVSRTTLQGWLYDILGWKKREEKDNTALQFSDEDVAIIWQIRLYKQLRYSNSEIEKIINDPDFDPAESLKVQIEELNRQKEELENLIKVATVMSSTGLTPSGIRLGFAREKQLKYRDAISLLSLMADNAEFELNTEIEITEGEAEIIFNAVDTIMSLMGNSKDVDSDEVQEQVRIIHGVIKRGLSDSLFVLQLILPWLAPGTDIARLLDGEYGKNAANFLYEAIGVYCSADSDAEQDREFVEAMSNIEQLAYERNSADSKKVQFEIARIHKAFEQIPIISSKSSVLLLGRIAQILGSEVYRGIYDGGRQKGIAWFISKAIEIYCDRYIAESDVM